MRATLLVIGGMIMFLLGRIGEDVGRIYISINQSPQYVVRERTF
jgi:undecaprenyl-phosphate 4-deoxy-4-formamido-L-arabinose transferase